MLKHSDIVFSSKILISIWARIRKQTIPLWAVDSFDMKSIFKQFKKAVIASVVLTKNNVEYFQISTL